MAASQIDCGDTLGFKLPKISEIKSAQADTSNLIRYEINRNYLHAIATVVKQTANDNDCNRGILTALCSQGGFTGLKNKPGTANTTLLGKMLRNSWTAEVAVRKALQSDDLIQASMVVPWSFVQMYYGLYHLFDAWLAIQSRQNSTSKHHSEFLDRYREVVCRRRFLPSPWGAAYCGASDTVSGLDYDGTKKIDVRVWNGPKDAPEMLAKSLKTTHQRRVDQRWERRDPRSKIKKKELTGSIGDTTIFDFVYRMRIGANYNDVDPYLINVRERQHIESLSESVDCFYSATMMVGEALIAKSLGSKRYFDLVSGYVEWVGAHNASPVVARRRLIVDSLGD